MFVILEAGFDQYFFPVHLTNGADAATFSGAQNFVVTLFGSDEGRIFNRPTGDCAFDAVSPLGSADNLTVPDNDKLSGTDGIDIHNLGVGGDVALGQSGGDSLTGGQGRDRLFGEAGHDVVSGNGGNDRFFGGYGKDVLKGWPGNDVPKGGRGADVVSGARGDDLLYAGRGADVLTGGRGADAFVFYVEQIGRNVVTDFNLGFDRFELSSALVGTTMSAQEVLETYGKSDEAGAVLRFAN